MNSNPTQLNSPNLSYISPPINNVVEDFNNISNSDNNEIYLSANFNQFNAQHEENKYEEVKHEDFEELPNEKIIEIKKGNQHFYTFGEESMKQSIIQENSYQMFQRDSEINASVMSPPVKKIVILILFTKFNFI